MVLFYEYRMDCWKEYKQKQRTDKEGVVLRMDRIRPYKNRKQAVKREKIIMFASSAVVLAALTMTGVYMKEKNAQDPF